MSNLYQRKLEQFQAKVQQNLELADDEIDRLSQYLNSLKMEILDSQDQIHRYEVQFIQDKNEKSGNEIKKASKKDAALARLESDHHSAVVKLSKEHIKHMNALRDDFEKSMASISENSEKKPDKELQLLDLEIKKMESKVTRANERLTGISQITFDNSEDEENESKTHDDDEESTYLRQSLQLQKQKIKYLQSNIKQRDNERLEALQDAKNQLAHAVSTLENLESQYLTKMNNYKETLEKMDKKYQKDITTLENGQKKVLLPVQKTLIKYNQRIKEIRKQIKKTEELQQKKLLDLAEKRNTLVSQYVSISSKSVESPNTEESHEVSRQFDAMKAVLLQKEEELSQARAENQNIKREIGRIKHELKMAKRRAALGL